MPEKRGQSKTQRDANNEKANDIMQFHVSHDLALLKSGEYIFCLPP